MPPEIAYKSFAFELKEVTEAGDFTGYGAIFGNVDLGGDLIEKGAFSASIAELKASGRALPALWSHWVDEPIGVYKEFSEDDRGLLLKGTLALDVQRASEVRSLAKMGAVTGMSIGYEIKDGGSYYDNQGVRHLTNLDLWEVSLVTFPMNPKAQISAVKGIPMTERQFEKLLRDAGFSKGQALGIIACGYNEGLKLRDSDESEKKEKQTAEISQLLKTLIEKF